VRKDTFYRCVREDKKIVAIKTTGYSENNIGIHKEGGFWIATHIPTGMRLTPLSSRNKSIKQALNEAKRLISEHDDFEKLLQARLESEIYEKFVQSKYKQSATGVF